MKRKFLSIMLVLCMVLSFVPTTVFAAETPYNLLIGDLYFTASKKTITVGDGTATFDPNNSKLTLNNITISYGTTSTAAVDSSIPNLKIDLIGTNTINITNDGMAGIYLYGGSNATITGTNGSKLIINSSGKGNKGITTGKGISLTMKNTTLIVNDKTTVASAKGYMVGIKSNGDLTMNGGSYTATGVQSGIEMYTDCVANLSGVNFNITCTPRQSFSSTIPNEMSIGLNLAPLTGKQNVIANCSGSISAHYPLYVDGVTELTTSQNLTLTTDNYDAVYVNSDLTVSGGTLNLTSTGSSGNGFYVLKSSKLAFTGSPNVTINVGYVAIFLTGDSASAEINSGTLNTTAKAGVVLGKTGNTFTLVNGTLEMTPKTGESEAIGIQSNGTVSVEGGSLKTTAGMYSAIQNAGEKSINFSGGTHTLSTSNDTGTYGYADTAKGTLNISGTADVTFDGWSDGIDLLGALNLSGGKLTVRNAKDGIYTTGTLSLTGGTLNTSGSRLGVFVGDGGLVNFAGTDATLVGKTAGWGKTQGSGAYSVTGGKVVLQGDSFAASTIYSSLAKGYSVYAGSSESNAALISNPTISTFTQNTYVRIEANTSYTLTLVNVKGATSASHVAGADLSYTAADAPIDHHFAYWEMKVGDGEAVKVGTDPTYTGKMPTGDATLTAVYENCKGGKATCQARPKCSVCGKEYGILAAHNLAAEVVDQKYEITPATCESEGRYYKSCTLCGASSENWNNATFTVPALGHTGGTATCIDKAVCSVCHQSYGDKDLDNHDGGTELVNVVPVNHKDQIDGYSGDTKCKGCSKIIAYGTTIPAGAHTPSSTWNSNETHHWKECTTMGCGVVIDGSKAEHSSTGANIATCQHKAVCDVCNVEYGALAAHNPASGWTSDASGHWHACQTANCTEKCDFASHTPDHTGHATEEYAIKCTECGYTIEAQLGHTHSMTQVAAKPATCTEGGNTAYYVCSGCGKWYEDAAGNAEITDHSSVLRGALDHDWADATCTAPKTCKRCGATEGDPLGHTEGTEWKYDSDNHWHTCNVAGCGVVIDGSKAAHTPDRASATETDPVKCSVCGYVITPTLGHKHDVDTTKFESDETNHWNTCSGCSEKQNVSAHDFEWKIDKEATATENGSKHEECKICGFEKAAVVIAAGMPGDVDLSNLVNLADVRAAIVSIANNTVADLDAKAFNNGDVNKDGKFNLSDVRMIVGAIANNDFSGLK